MLLDASTHTAGLTDCSRCASGHSSNALFQMAHIALLERMICTGILQHAMSTHVVASTLRACHSLGCLLRICLLGHRCAVLYCFFTQHSARAWPWAALRTHPAPLDSYTVLFMYLVSGACGHPAAPLRQMASALQHCGLKTSARSPVRMITPCAWRSALSLTDTSSRGCLA
jgi:hypothetical protein